MHRTTNAQLVTLLLLALLCGTCLGLLLPRPPAATGGGTAASSEPDARPSSPPLPQAVAAMAYAEEEGPSPAPETESKTAVLIFSPSIAPSPALTPAPAQENLFAIAVAPDRSGEPSPEPGTAAPSPTAHSFAIEVVRAKDDSAPPKRVLIYHTHTYEAYQKTGGVDYRETEAWRTADPRYNVVRVGEELAGLLRGLGVDVEHDTTAFEPPELSAAYTRSLEMLERRTGMGERYDLYIDIHRDAYTPSQAAANTVNAGSSELARLMLLVGRGDGQTSEGYSQKPNWESNLRIARAITDSLNAQRSGLCKDVMVKSGRYNQHVAPCCILVEAGNNQNTLAQALASMPYLADAVAEALELPGDGTE